MAESVVEEFPPCAIRITLELLPSLGAAAVFITVIIIIAHGTVASADTDGLIVSDEEGFNGRDGGGRRASGGGRAGSGHRRLMLLSPANQIGRVVMAGGWDMVRR